MRKLFVLLTTLALILALPASAIAQEERTQVVLDVTETQTGVTADGSLLTQGTYELSLDGFVLETGVERTVYQVGETTARGTRMYRNTATGDTATTLIKAWLIDADEENGVFIWAFNETLISSSEGVSGHGTGIAVVTVHPDGSFSLESSADVILNFG